MSVINKMLRDLDKRGATPAAGEGIPTGLGTPLPEALSLDTCVLDVSITPNRADCLSVLGIAILINMGTNIIFGEISFSQR